MTDLHLIQYRIDGRQETTVACHKHRPPILAALREVGVGCLGMTAPDGATCDGCRTEAVA